ncbi:MAG: J domain-containing protein [Sandaracinaceae bacterium]|nr:J domain-containing protein [Sandaracinaceae bacterium]
MSDPFEILGVSTSASQAELRAAFRRLALLHHPDRNRGDAGAAERFKRVLRAYRAALRGPRTGAAPEPPPAGPRPDRYGCGRCGDTFPSRSSAALRRRALGSARGRAGGARRSRGRAVDEPHGRAAGGRRGGAGAAPRAGPDRGRLARRRGPRLDDRRSPRAGHPVRRLRGLGHPGRGHRLLERAPA